MKKILVFAAVSLFAVHSLYASFDTKKGTRPLAMGGAFTGFAGSAEALYYNPASLWLLSYPALTGFYSTPYNLKELRTTTVGIVWPTSYGNAATLVESYGFDLYRETSATLGWSGSFREFIAIGLMAGYHHLAIKGGGDGSTIGLSAGLLLRPHEKITVGFSAQNFNHPSIAGDALPESGTLGVAYRPLQDWVITADLYKDVRFPTDVRVGSEYRILEKLFIRGGLSSEPSRFSGGLGFDFGLGQVDYAFYTHRSLGWTHAVSLSFYWDRKPERQLSVSL